MTSKEKKFAKQLNKAMDFYSNSKLKNEYLMNKLAGYVALLTEAGIILALFLNMAGVFILDNEKILLLVILSFPLAIGLFLITDIFKIEKRFIKYVVMVLQYSIITLCYMFLTMHVVLVLCVPLIISLLYFNRKYSMISGVCSIIFMFIGHIGAVYLTIVPDDVLDDSIFQALVYGFVPRVMEIIIINIICAFITYKSNTMMNNGYEYADKTMQLMNDQKKTHYEIVKNLATISENKSPDIGGHISRVYEYMWILCRGFGYNDDESYNISLAAMLHDVGKLGVNETILSKPGRLTPEEFEEVKKHVTYGKNLLATSTNSVLKMAEDIAEHHHERWDGKGYLGLKGDEINRLSCMMSVVDVFDALTSKRCYKDAWPIEQAYDEIINGRGTQFSPEVIDMFIKYFDEIKEVYNRTHKND